jgi:hypothetical protein
MGACYGGTDVMERPCAMARGKDINSSHSQLPAGAVLVLVLPSKVPSELA